MPDELPARSGVRSMRTRVLPRRGRGGAAARVEDSRARCGEARGRSGRDAIGLPVHPGGDEGPCPRGGRSGLGVRGRMPGLEVRAGPPGDASAQLSPFSRPVRGCPSFRARVPQVPACHAHSTGSLSLTARCTARDHIAVGTPRSRQPWAGSNAGLAHAPLRWRDWRRASSSRESRDRRVDRRGPAPGDGGGSRDRRGPATHPPCPAGYGPAGRRTRSAACCEKTVFHRGEFLLQLGCGEPLVAGVVDIAASGCLGRPVPSARAKRWRQRSRRTPSSAPWCAASSRAWRASRR